MNRRNVSPRDDGDNMIKASNQYLLTMFAALAGLKRTGETCDVFLQVEPKSTTMAAVREAAETGVWAHRAVLGAASPYFHDVFENSDQQCQRLVIMVPRVTSDILRLLVDNVYTPTSLSVTVEEGRSLLAAATRLSVADVRDEASAYLARSLAVDNVLGILVTAKSNDCPALTALAENFIQKNSERVLQMDELLSLQSSMLGKLLARGKLAAPAQSTLEAVLRWTMHRPQERRQHLSSLLEVVQLPQVPRQLLFKVSREEPIIKNAPALHLIALVFAGYDHTQKSKNNTQKSGRSVDSKLGSSRLSGLRAAVSTPHIPLAVGDCNKNAEVIPDVSSYELPSRSSQAAAATMLDDRSFKGPGTKNGQKSGRSVDSKLASSRSRSEPHAAVSTSHIPPAVGDCNKNAEVIPDYELPSGSSQAAAGSVPAGRVRAAVAVFDDRSFKGPGTKNEQKSGRSVDSKLASSRSSGLRAAVSTPHIPLAVGDCNKNAEVIPDYELPSGSSQAAAGSVPAGRVRAAVAVFDDRSFKGPVTKNEQKSGRSVDSNLASSRSWSGPHAAVSTPHIPLAVGDCNKNAEVIPDYELPSGSSQAAAGSVPAGRVRAAVAVFDDRSFKGPGTKIEQKSGRSVDSERQQHLFEPLLPPGELTQRVRAEPLVSAEQRVQHQVFEAMASHLTVSEGRELTSGTERRTQQPLATVSGLRSLLVVGGFNNRTGSTSDVLSLELSSGRWQSAAALPAARSYAGVAVLDGRVYVVGGDDGYSTMNTVLVYDVARGSWSSGPSLTTSRWYLAAATLDGVLYAVGGLDSGSGPVLSSAEAFDPREGVWRSIASMSTARAGLGVAALGGRLYAVGGQNAYSLLNTVERYDPSSASWETVDSMSERRADAAVCVVDDVLYAAGGWHGSTAHRSVERYRAGSGWEPAPSMNTARRLAAATTHDGRLYVAGGANRDVNLSSVEVFSPTSVAWSELPAAMPEGRVAAGAVVVYWPPYGTKNEQKTDRSVDSEPQQHLFESLPSEELELRVQHQLDDVLASQHKPSEGRELTVGRERRSAAFVSHALLVVGGYEQRTGCTPKVLSYLLSSGRWQSAGAMQEARTGAGVAVLDGRVYVVGGWDGFRRVNSVVVYDVAHGSWSPGPSLKTTRWWLAAAALDGLVYAVGGRDFYLTPLSSAEALDPREGVWRPIASMSTARFGLGVAALHRQLYAVGGDNGTGTLKTVERYDPSSARWEPMDSMSEQRSLAAVCVVDDLLYAAGGWNGSTTHRSVERYRAGSGWEPAPSMITARRHAAVATHDGRLYVAGGLYDRDAVLSSVEVFSPSSAAWSELRAMPANRAGASAVVVYWPPPAERIYKRLYKRLFN